MIPKFLASSFLSPPNFSRWFLTGLKNTSKCVSTKNVKENLHVKFEKITQTSKLRVRRRELWSRKVEPVGCLWGWALEWRALEWGSKKTAPRRCRKKGILYEVREISTRSEKLELVRGLTKRAFWLGRTKRAKDYKNYKDCQLSYLCTRAL